MQPHVNWATFPAATKFSAGCQSARVLWLGPPFLLEDVIELHRELVFDYSADNRIKNI